MIIEMFSKLIAIQLLLLYAGTKSEDYPTKLVPRQGNIRHVTNVTWKVPQEFQPIVTCDRKKYKDDLDIITAAVIGLEIVSICRKRTTHCP